MSQGRYGAGSPLLSVATLSKDSRFFGREFYPVELVGGKGARVYDTTGRGYIDWISGLGAVSIGHGVPEWVRRVCKVVESGVAFSLPHVLERQVADKLVALLAPRVPNWAGRELGVRFGLAGSDATDMAIRLCRAATGRNRVLSNGYHGWHSEFVATTPPAWGVVPGMRRYIQEFAWGVMPQNAGGQETGEYWPATEVHTSGLPSLADCFARGPKVAAVIIEVLPENPPAGWFDHIRALCDQHEALFILDEVVTSPRYAVGGAAQHYQIYPDVICLGKGWGNGLPFSAIVADRALMAWFDPDARPNHDPVFVSSTHFGNAVSLAAANAVLDIWDDECVQHVWRIGGMLMDGLRQVGYTVVGHPPRSLLQFESQAERAFFIREMAQLRVLINRPNLPNLAHTERDVARTVRAAAEVKQAMAGRDLEREMAGQLPLVLFSNR